jgi:hypothetical protein
VRCFAGPLRDAGLSVRTVSRYEQLAAPTPRNRWLAEDWPLLRRGARPEFLSRAEAVQREEFVAGQPQGDFRRRAGFVGQNSGSLRAGSRRYVAFLASQYRSKFLIFNLKPAPGFEAGTY